MPMYGSVITALSNLAVADLCLRIVITLQAAYNKNVIAGSYNSHLYVTDFNIFGTKIFVT